VDFVVGADEAGQGGRTVTVFTTRPDTLFGATFFVVAADSPLAGLTTAGLRVARLVAAGLTNRQIASQLTISPHTVDSHLRSIYNRLGVNSRVELTRIMLAQDEELR
jgi:DNA-binding CsgD family transcriptional regulator